MKNYIVLLTALAFASALPTEVAAASIEFTSTIQTSLDKTIASASQIQARTIQSLHTEFLNLQKQDQNWESKIDSLHNRNKDTAATVNKQSKEIDNAKIASLEADVLQARERHKPLLSRYTTLNKQIEAARSFKSRSLNALLRIQATALKIPVGFARADIASKVKIHKTAKDSAAQAAKKIRDRLDDIDPINAQIKAKQGAIKATQNSLSSTWSAFKQAAKKSDPTGVQNSLSSMVSLSRQIIEEEQKIFKLESTVSETLAAIQLQMN
ncbi:hypothetical protein LOZ80_33130 [Paenibacillus sp. HWE-109]|uniref:hypothetical protein n=1 Tax=Paenibacillus sp. HWE-109 TaxID=1306526 RepID=UPI001EDFBE02|nr:hypothetical protein [Paenibacillus sp. HWE-109]UKS26317.1 hypothetical protein LOZ80_33130 [Paenibacillus sp. HWE-109]